MNTKQIIDEAVKRAQVIARTNGITVGATVAHPSYKLTCELIEVKGDIAILEVNGNFLEFPSDEIFDVNLAKDIALQIQNELN
jgi:hypothetical protein